MKKLILISELLYGLLLSAGCVSPQYLQGRMDGVFISKKDSLVKFIIDGENFYIIDARKHDHLASLCCDTVTFGYISQDPKGFLVLNSAHSLNPIFVDMEVVERQNADPDSVVFHINNPVEQEYRRYNKREGDLIYTLSVQPIAKSLDYFKENNKTFENNLIRYYNPAQASISSFKITIVPKVNIPVKYLAVREVHTLEYTVKSKKSNSFEINIPQLSYGFLSYRRLNGDYAKIVDQKTIIWDGMEFEKTSPRN